MKLVLVSEEVFDQIVKKTRLHKRGRELARMVLVDGAEQSQAAKASGVSHQYVNKVISIVTQRFEQLASADIEFAPSALTTVDIPMPSSLAVELEKTLMQLNQSNSAVECTNALIQSLKKFRKTIR